LTPPGLPSAKPALTSLFPSSLPRPTWVPQPSPKRTFPPQSGVLRASEQPDMPPLPRRHCIPVFSPFRQTLSPVLQLSRNVYAEGTFTVPRCRLSPHLWCHAQTSSAPRRNRPLYFDNESLLYCQTNWVVCLPLFSSHTLKVVNALLSYITSLFYFPLVSRKHVPPLSPYFRPSASIIFEGDSPPLRWGVDYLSSSVGSHFPPDFSPNVCRPSSTSFFPSNSPHSGRARSNPWRPQAKNQKKLTSFFVCGLNFGPVSLLPPPPQLSPADRPSHEPFPLFFPF